MTQYRFPNQQHHATPQRVRAQRAVSDKRTVAEGMQEGAIIRASILKERYQREQQNNLLTLPHQNHKIQ